MIDCVRLGTDERFVELRAAARPPVEERYWAADVRFYVGGLSGAWTTDLVNVEDFVGALDRLYANLSGEAALSDDDGLTLTFRMDRAGRVTVEVWVNNQWSFGIAGETQFDLLGLDQTFLPQIAKAVRETFLIKAAPARATA
jgi:hypothetical protein